MEKLQDRAAKLLSEIRELSELNGENPFKTRAYERAESVVAACGDLERRTKAGTLTELAGIGKGISEILTEFALHGTSKIRDELQASLPPGLMELIQVPGLGPKKAKQVIEDLGIHTLAELEYACRENRLLKLKGFGEKIQTKVLEGIQFLKTTQDRARLVDSLPTKQEILRVLRKTAPDAKVEPTGALRRELEVLDRLEFLVGHPEKGVEVLKKKIEKALQDFRKENPATIAIDLKFAPLSQFGYEWAKTTATPEHWKALGSPAPFDASTETEFFKKFKIEVIPPEMRETGEEVALAKRGGLSEVLPQEGIVGIFHNHTTLSDGVATLEEMVREAQSLGYSYIGISDHSQSAFYANGLKADALKTQEKEIKKVQEKFPDIRIFWGVESDILADGELDYPVSILKKFDFVIASIHSRFKMDRDQMTDRILNAVRNPATRFLGHMTGRLILGRPGYDIDMEKIREESSKNNVAIEINANPARLDIDWRWGSALRKHKTLVSVNPDAHSLEGLRDTPFGVTVARKALLPVSQVVNARSAQEVAKWLERK